MAVAEDRLCGEAQDIIEPGRNCWRYERTERLAVLVDGAAYYAAVKRAILAARHQIMMVGWDVDGRVHLERREPLPGVPDVLRDLLNFVVERRPDLIVHVLLWDFSVLHVPEREPLPRLNLDWRTWPQVRVRLDDVVPLGGAHHQKIVTVDDRLAFVGGLDISDYRWDSPSHDPADPHRVTSWGQPYQPFHDVQAMFDGAAAAAVAELARRRWAEATGEILPPPPPVELDPWPDTAVPDFTDVRIAVSRTLPPLGGRPGVREVEALYLDAIAAARRWIYIENQYLTADAIARAVAARLAEPHGPEVVIVGPRHCPGWLEEQTMGALRIRFLRQVAAADRHGRLRVLRPSLGDAADTPVMVHAKLMIVDDRLLRIGSSNLNNRSMGFDSECDIAVEAASDADDIAAAIAGVRNRLLAEHLGTSPAAVAALLAETGSLVQVVERPGAGGRALVPLDPPAEVPDEMMEALAAVADPERPGRFQELLDRLGAEQREARRTRRLRWLAAILAVILLAGLAAAWRYTPLADWIDPELAAAWLEWIRQSAWAPAIMIGLYVVLGLVMFPITALIAGTAIAFGPWNGFTYAIVGSLISAVAAFGVGKLVGRRFVRRIAGRRIARISGKLARSGVLAVMTLRMLPVAPFTVVNLVAGASGVRLPDYVVGTILGMAPGIIVMTLLGNQLEALWTNPNATNIGLLGLVVVAWFGLGFGLQRLLGHRRNGG